MANEKNLKKGNPETQYKSGRKAVENGRKGGIASGESKRERKTIQNLLNDFLDSDVKDQKSLKKLATSVGIKGDRSVKELVTVVCVLNTLKKGDVDKLQKICEILGEDNNIQMLEDISEAEGDIFGND